MRVDLRAVGLALVVACARTPERAHEAPPVALASAPVSAAATDAGPDKLLADEDVGPLLARLSESPGDFPSENYVSNETSVLDVAPTLRDPKLRGRAYVGVGPEQNYTYLALTEPRVAYVVDIRRGNMLEHMFFRGCFEAGETRVAFLRALLARRVSDAPPDLASLFGAFAAAPQDRALRDEGVARTRALLDRLHVVRARGDDATIARVAGAFATHGLAIAYTTGPTQKDYPSLGETLAAKDPSGAPASFLASEESYARVRRLVVENRVLPVVGDFGGARALRAVGDDMRARGVSLGVFYASNVEQYLFDGRRHGAFVASVAAMPRDDASRIVRVWFEQGKALDAQRLKHPTTQVTIRADAFLARAKERPFRSYREVVAQPDAPPR